MSDIMAGFLSILSEGRALTEDEAFRLMDSIMAGEATATQIGGVLMALRVRGETPDELTGFARAMRQHAMAVPVARRPLLDTCGTGGDRSFTFNVSTVSAFVVAGAGVPVAKHGNRSATSKSGSADLLEALGIPIETDPRRVADMIDQVGFGFLFAQNVHHAMRHAAPARRELGVRTVFNLLGPMTNPCQPEYQLMGVFASGWIRPVTEVLARLGSKRAFVVHGHGGLDEISLSGPTEFGLVDGGHLRFGTITPEDFGLPSYPVGSFGGGDPITNASICRDILAGRAPGPLTDMVLANAGAALYVAGVTASLREGARLASDVIAEGKAAQVLEDLATHPEVRGA